MIDPIRSKIPATELVESLGLTHQAALDLAMPVGVDGDVDVEAALVWLEGLAGQKGPLAIRARFLRVRLLLRAPI